MRTLLLVALLAAPFGAHAASPRTIVLDVKNMTCGLCPVTVKSALGKVSGVADTSIDMATMTATVKFDPDKTSVDALVKATTNAGFPSTPRK